ncbi:MAG TPA: STAS domain-containing protein [Mycobacteriales bacterium]|nr:STAS domain-containing protein [Mycobacteriales bacterium]
MTAVTLVRTSDDDELGEFAIDVVRADGQETVRVRGELDIATAPLLRAALEGVYARRPVRVEVDLSEVTFLDASSLAGLIAARRRLAAQRAVLVLVDPSPIVRRVLDITGLDRMTDVRTPADRTGPQRSPRRLPVRCMRPA